jgi:tRNA modification GTPase
MDTAGFRKMKTEVEKIGVHLTEQRLSEADLVLVVVDQSRPLGQEDLKTIDRCKGKRSIIVVNKLDLPSRISEKARRHAFSGLPVVRISALTGQGMADLKKAIFDFVMQGDEDMTSFHSVPNLRHGKALMNAEAFFQRAAQNIDDNVPMEIITMELRSGLDALGEITGETTSEEILESIFSQFCLGK